ncbi:MAG: D-alanyl-D-alanine carboxypeptidase/D-alanyl-D-alanine-endopeptidase [Actinomycetota bacterium]|nr:D-alanyl-D-alanine carboxypeptidase/D-alanyl-D-alanine-endopeptidase [Actinomycetota bacterium]
MPSRRRLVAPLLAALTAALAAPAASAHITTPLAQELSRALAVPHVRRSSSAALVFDLTRGSKVFSLNERRPLAPASNEKLAVTFAALTTLGGDYRIETTVLGDGELTGTTWRGRLILQGRGDPTLSNSDLVALARQVRDAGIRRVTGAIVGDESYFDSRRTAPGWKPSFYINESPPLSALTVDRTWYIDHFSTVPALAAAFKFRYALRRAGIAIGGAATTGRAGVDVSELAGVESPPMSAIVRYMDHESDNFTAELLTKQLAAAGGSVGSTSVGATAVFGALLGAGVPVNGVRLVDGSGLSYLNRLTARALAGLLRAAWADPDIGVPLFAALPVAGVNGTLRHRLRTRPARGNVVAKTGTLNIASALSGFVRRRYVFSVLQNGYPLSVGWARTAQDRFVSVLAAH